MKRAAIIGAAALVLAAGVLYAKREPLALGYFASRLDQTPLADREALLGPAMTVIPPTDVPPPWPAVIQLHGCAGMRANFMEEWAKAANEAGYAAIIVDSLAPRGIDRARAIASVCRGKELIGQERAGDALAAYELVRRRADIDASRIVLAGWSHGAWAAMDLLALAPPRRMPAGLRREEGEAPLQIAGVILVYPYCGLGSWTRALGWPSPVPALALIAGADTIVDPKACPPLFKRLETRGADIDVVIYPGADHVFDDPFLEPAYQSMYNPEFHADAARRYVEFLRNVEPVAPFSAGR